MIAASRLLTLVCIGWAFASHGFAQQERVRVERGTLQVEVDASGTVEAARRHAIRSPMEGETTLLWIIPEGTHVKQGDKVAELDGALVEQRLTEAKVELGRASAEVAVAELGVRSAELGMKEAEAESMLEQLEAQLALAEAEEVIRLEGEAQIGKLLREVATTRLELAKLRGERRGLDAARELDRARSDLSIVREERMQRASQVESLQVQLSKATLTAEIEGMVIHANQDGRSIEPLDPGAVLRERQGILDIVDPEVMVVRALVSESRIQEVEVGGQVVVETHLPDVLVSGRVERVAPLPERSWRQGPDAARYYAVRIELADSPRELRPGMSVQARIAGEARSGVLIVPIAAIAHLESGFTCVVEKDGQRGWRGVQVGANDGKRLEITDGLEEGEIVIVPPRLQ